MQAWCCAPENSGKVQLPSSPRGYCTFCKIRVHLNQPHTALHLNRTHVTEKSSFERTSFFQRCVPLARNVMCPSGVMFASQVMCASRVRSGTRHTTLRQRRNTSLWRSHNITAATTQHHFFLPHNTKTTDKSEPPHRRGRRLDDPKNTVQTGCRGRQPLPFKIYLQKHRCNGILDRFELTKAFLREEGGPRSGGRSLRDFEI